MQYEYKAVQFTGQLTAGMFGTTKGVPWVRMTLVDTKVKVKY